MYLTPRDIQNLNNTCFANSVLQALLSSERFSKGLESIQHNRDKCSAKRTGEKLYMIITISLPPIFFGPMFRSLILEF